MLDWGYFQINTVHLERLGLKLRSLVDCKANIAFAYTLFLERGFQAWSPPTRRRPSRNRSHTARARRADLRIEQNVWRGLRDSLAASPPYLAAIQAETKASAARHFAPVPHLRTRQVVDSTHHSQTSRPSTSGSNSIQHLVHCHPPAERRRLRIAATELRRDCRVKLRQTGPSVHSSSPRIRRKHLHVPSPAHLLGLPKAADRRN